MVGLPELSFEDAFSYISAVKEAFRDEPYKYQEFIMTLQYVTNHRNHEAVCFTKVEELMKNHPNLFLGFKVFLKRTIPPEAMITTISPEANATIPPKAKPITPLEAMITTISPEAKPITSPEAMMMVPYEANTSIPTAANPITIPEAANTSATKRKIVGVHNFLDKVKTRFKTVDAHKVESLCKIMNEFKKGKMSEEEVYAKVVHNVLYYHEDLVYDFNKFFKQDYNYLCYL